MNQDGKKPVVSPTRMPIEVLGRLVSCGGSVEEATIRIRRDIEAGAPVNDDGTMNMVSYSAWLVRESGSSGNNILSIPDTQLGTGLSLSSENECGDTGVEENHGSNRRGGGGDWGGDGD